MKRLTHKEFVVLFDNDEIKDISEELPNGFMVVGQFMRAKVLWAGKKWLASGWRNGTDPYVTLKESAL